MITQTVTIPQQQTIQLRDYQTAMIAEAYALIRSKYLRVLMIAVMGAGKTVIAAQIMRDAASKGRRCVFLVSLNVLLEQTARILQTFGVHCTILQGDRQVDEAAPVIVASLQTISSRLRRGKDLGSLLGCVDVIVADEAHISAFQSAYSAIDAFFPNAIRIGLTATPWRLNTREWLGQRYDKAVLGPQPPEIIKRGGAVSCRGFTLTGAIDLETLRVRGGDFVDSDIAEQACQTEALNHVIDEWSRLCLGRPTLMVGATVEQAHLTCDRFNQRGIVAEVIVGSTPAHEREAIFEHVRQGKTKVICSVGCLTAGFDLPAISAILYVRATKSRALFQQTAGRGSRPYPCKMDYFLLDFGGNLKRFGNPMGFQNYDISQPVQDEDVQPLTKTCPGCQLEVTVFAQICPHCGHEFTDEMLPDDQKQEALVLAQLNEFADTLTRQKIKTLRQLKRQAYESDRSPDDAIAHFVSEFGHNPPVEWMRHACLTQRYSPSRKAAFVNYLFRHCNQASKWSQQWISYHLTLELGEADLQITPWYETLGVDRNASWETVKAAYITKAEALDPDKAVEVDLEALQQQLNLALSDAREVVK